MTRTTTGAALLLLALAACAPGGGDPDAGANDGGPSDAGTNPTPLPFPAVLLDDVRLGTSFTFEMQGIVKEHGPATTWPDHFGDVHPARVLTLRRGDGSTQSVFYSLPTGFGLAATPGTALRLLYRELAADSGLSSHGLRLLDTTDRLVAIVEDGIAGPAFDDAERLDIGFTLEELALGETTDPCGRRVGYPLTVSVSGTERRMLPGETKDFTLVGGAPIRLTLLDAYRLEDDVCGGAPAFSFAWIGRPGSP